MNSSRLSAEEYIRGIRAGNRIILAQAITLAESTLPGDQEHAGAVLEGVMSFSGKALRMGITGAPGVGKSSFIEAFGHTIIASGRKLAVLTIDPSSPLTGGSILGDKTRMETLAKDPRVFIRPTPSGLALGGVAGRTREAMLLCEAAGYDFIIVETVGTGQSEVAVRSMVDFFLLLMLPGSGDELQGIKKGIVEMADAIAITKADGENARHAAKTKADFGQALHLLAAQPSGWTPKVMTCSALERTGLEDILALVETFARQLEASGYLQENRRRQQAAWLQEHFEYLLATDHKRFPELAAASETMRTKVLAQELSPRHAARELLALYHKAVRGAT